jgi:Fe-S-cluster containining protein
LKVFMPADFFTWPEIRSLLARSLPRRQSLQDLYAQLPATRCRRRANCCALLPEASLVEVLAALAAIQKFPAERRLGLLKKAIRYFLVNPLEITSCPFLEGADCLIYDDRFFGCRAYGLWSPEEYGRRAEANRQAKRNMGAHWLRLGLRLPPAVLAFQVPYCREVFPDDERPGDDRALTAAEEEIEKFSDQRGSPSDRFRNLYFSDLSFLLAGLLLGIPEALRLKFTVVQTGLRTGSRQGLDESLRGLEHLEDPLG